MKIFKKRLLIVFIFVLNIVLLGILVKCEKKSQTISSEFSGQVSVQQAIQVAKTVASEQNLRGGVGGSAVAIRGVFPESLKETNLIYVVKFLPVGFALISADKRIIPILGYSFETDYEEGKIPYPLSELIEQWKAEIQLIIEESPPENPRTTEQWRKLQTTRHQRNNRTVLPLMATNWDQGYPWNQYCPIDEDGPGDHVWAGCVAVSMAQVMKYWNYPDIGVGSHSYYHVDYGTLSADFGETEYDFASMLNNSANPAVKTLLLHCGVAVEMDYGPDGSGAWVGLGNPNAAQALRIRFAYEQNLEFYSKFQFEETEWTEMLRTELDEGRPVIYRGVSDDFGHAWNIDGYQDSIYFHCNWGWSGSYNGYYYLDDLSPGFGSDFSSSQGMIVGIQPIPTDVSAIALNPVSLNFGEVTLGSSVSQTIEILSVGSQTLELLLLNIVGEYADQFEITDEIDDFELLPGESENIEVTFTPIEVNTVFAIFQVESNSYENSLKTAMMTATGIISSIKGDVNFDDTIDVLDVIQAVNYIMGLVEPNENQFWASDMNDDMTINVLDVIEIVNLILQ